jgi:alanine dehydrogenase
MIILSNDDVARLLPMEAAITVVSDIMKTVSRGTETLPLRTAIPVGGANKMGVMPGAITDPACFGVKLVSLFPTNPSLGLSSHRGAIVLFESETGGAIAMMDAGLLTAIRTAAASGVATDILARKEASSLVLVGYGEQAEFHLDAICTVRPIETVEVVGRSAEKAAQFIARAVQKYPNIRFCSGTDVEKAVKTADIICTVTASPAPILEGRWLTRGSHINAVGSSIPTMRELDDEIVDMIKSGLITKDDIQGEIGAVLSGEINGRQDKDQITLYRSLGIAAQDLSVAHFVVTKAKENNLGQQVAF